MSANPHVFAKSSDEGVARVRNGSYAYLMESTSNEYIRQRDCELMQIGGLLDTKGYGIGTPPGSPWRDIISKAILQLQEEGDLQELYTKWWMIEDKDPNQKCDSGDDKKGSAVELSIESIGGIFVIMAVGMALSLLIATIEFLHKAQITNDKHLLIHIKNGLKQTICNFFKPKFFNPFPKHEKEKKKYEPLILMARMESCDDSISDHDYLRHSEEKIQRITLI